MGSGVSKWAAPETVILEKDPLVPCSIGITLGGRSQCVIVKIAPGSIAARAQPELHVGDRLFSVNGAPAGGPRRAIKLLNGASGKISCVINKPAEFALAVAMSREEARAEALSDAKLLAAVAEAKAADAGTGVLGGATQQPVGDQETGAGLGCRRSGDER